MVGAIGDWLVGVRSEERSESWASDGWTGGGREASELPNRQSKRSSNSNLVT